MAEISKKRTLKECQRCIVGFIYKDEIDNCSSCQKPLKVCKTCLPWFKYNHDCEHVDNSGPISKRRKLRPSFRSVLFEFREQITKDKEGLDFNFLIEDSESCESVVKRVAEKLDLLPEWIRLVLRGPNKIWTSGYLPTSVNRVVVLCSLNTPKEREYVARKFRPPIQHFSPEQEDLVSRMTDPLTVSPLIVGKAVLGDLSTQWIAGFYVNLQLVDLKIVTVLREGAPFGFKLVDVKGEVLAPSYPPYTHLGSRTFIANPQYQRPPYVETGATSTLVLWPYRESNLLIYNDIISQNQYNKNFYLIYTL